MHAHYLKMAIDLAIENAKANQGGPYGAIIVHQGQIISSSANQVTSLLDPTAHAEIQAIRQACQQMNDFQLNDCTLYSSCEPCPMCLGAIYWARVQQVFYACDRYQASSAGFDDSFIYDECAAPTSERNIKFSQIKLPNATKPFEIWSQQPDKILY